MSRPVKPWVLVEKVESAAQSAWRQPLPDVAAVADTTPVSPGGASPRVPAGQSPFLSRSETPPASPQQQLLGRRYERYSGEASPLRSSGSSSEVGHGYLSSPSVPATPQLRTHATASSAAVSTASASSSPSTQFSPARGPAAAPLSPEQQSLLRGLRILLARGNRH